MIVATNDLETIRVAEGQGAQVCTSKLLIQEMKKAKKESEEKLLDPGAAPLLSYSR